MNHIKKLQTKLEEVSDEKIKKWFENHLKKVISYRGLLTPTVVKIVSQWRIDEAIDKLSLKKQMGKACDLTSEKKDKLAGIAYIRISPGRGRGLYSASELKWPVQSGSIPHSGS